MVALDDVSLSVMPGKLTAVIGGRGAGKTTLLKIAAGLERPDAGHVSIDGQRLDQLSDHDATHLRRTKLGCVWASGLPVGRFGVLDLIALPLRLQTGNSRAARVEAQRTLAMVDAQHCADATVDNLSDGERRLVAVAQALVTKPRLMLLDQPAADLSLTDERALLEVLSALAAEASVAVLMTARSATEAVAAGVIATMSAGRIVSGEAASNDIGGADVLPLKPRKRDALAGDDDA